MVDLQGQYKKLKSEIDAAVHLTLDSSQYINGQQVSTFENKLAKFIDANHVIGCANGTDALQIALMALDLKPGDEVIVPSFTYVATAEVIALLGLTPIMVDADYDTFNIDITALKKSITPNTKAIIPVHLFGQACAMAELLAIAKDNNLFIIEDNAQSIGADYSDDKTKIKTGLIGDIGTTSFYPSKNLGAYGDGGALTTNDDKLAEKIRRIANHGQNKKYHHSMVGVNSRLDSIQAGILSVKLDHLETFNQKRYDLAQFYNIELASIKEIIIPKEDKNSTHVYHQYTLKVLNNKRDDLKTYLQSYDIPSMIYYPIPLYKQEAYRRNNENVFHPVTEQLCKEVLSLPMHPDMREDQRNYIVQKVKEFFEY